MAKGYMVSDLIKLQCYQGKKIERSNVSVLIQPEISIQLVLWHAAPQIPPLDPYPPPGFLTSLQNVIHGSRTLQSLHPGEFTCLDQ